MFTPTKAHPIEVTTPERPRHLQERAKDRFGQALGMALLVPVLGVLMASVMSAVISRRKEEHTEAGFTTPEIILLTAVGVAMAVVVGVLIYNAVVKKGTTVSHKINTSNVP